MSSPEPAPLLLRIRSEAEPIAGELCRPGSSPVPFQGWMELVALIEQWRAEPREVVPPPRPA